MAAVATPDRRGRLHTGRCRRLLDTQMRAPDGSRFVWSGDAGRSNNLLETARNGSGGGTGFA